MEISDCRWVFFASGLAQYETDWVIAISHRKHRQHLRNTQVTINIIIFKKKKIILILLCFFFANVWHNALFSGQGLMAGCYGNMLFGVECIEGSYPITTAVLEFISNIIEPFFKDSMESELMASFMYILREIFPVFQKWRFYKLKTRELIGKCITESIFWADLLIFDSDAVGN